MFGDRYVNPRARVLPPDRGYDNTDKTVSTSTRTIDVQTGRPLKRVRVWHVKSNAGAIVHTLPFSQLDKAYELARNLPGRAGFVSPGERME